MTIKHMFIANWKNMSPIHFATNSLVEDPRLIVAALKMVNPAITNINYVNVSDTHFYSFLE